MKIRKISAIILMVTVIIMISNSVTAREGDMVMKEVYPQEKLWVQPVMNIKNPYF
jgi:hypothetical protein